MGWLSTRQRITGNPAATLAQLKRFAENEVILIRNVTFQLKLHRYLDPGDRPNFASESRTRLTLAYARNIHR